MVAVLDELVDEGLPAPTAPVTQKLHWLLQSILQLLENGIGRGGIAAVLTDSDPEFTNALRSRMADRLRVLEEAMTADIAAGRLNRQVDPDTLVGLLFGSYLSEVLRFGEPRAGWAQRTVELLAPAVTSD